MDIRVLKTDMFREVQLLVMSLTAEILKQHPKFDDEDVSKEIIMRMEKAFGPYWSCIIGRGMVR